MIELDAATFCLQWATGGLLFLWVTTRRREVGIGYGWLMRATYGIIAAIGVVAGFRYGSDARPGWRGSASASRPDRPGSRP